VAAHCGGNARAVANYVQEVEAAFARYLTDRAEVYATERRWPDAPFWRRRSGLSGS
jgi:hypothetical protein